MSAYKNSNGDEPADDRDKGSRESSSVTLNGVSLRDSEFGEILRVLIAEGVEAAMDAFFEAKDPNIDPLLKLKLRNLGSSLGDNARKAIATHATHFGGQA